MEEGDTPGGGVVKGQGLALAPKIVPNNHRPSKVNNSRAFTVDSEGKKMTHFFRSYNRRKKTCPFFSGRAACRCSNKACLCNLSRKYSKNWLRRTKSNIRYTLKPSNYDAKPWFLHKRKSMFTPFLRDRPWNFAHVFNLLLPSLLRIVCFSMEMLDLLRPKYPINK